ncbi:MAG TPA: malonyl-CoA decarboxylase family protein [Burkholderiales bacterium]|nr:malonyl-CoA decarboxylase family protein [Burkholderiales bacterium]
MDRATDGVTPATPIPNLSTFGRIRDWWQGFAASLLPARAGALPDRATARLVSQLRHLFEESRSQRGGEVSARARAEQIAAIYRGASLPQRAAILNLITHEFAPDRNELATAIAAMQAAGNEVELGSAEARLRLALDAPRATFLAQFNLLPDGVKFLVDLRSDLLGLLEQDSGLEVLKVELDGLLERWFDPGFLELKRITWQSPALVLEKLMAYEAVHPIASWSDLRNRLDTDRRCYAFFHPKLPNEPLIFVEIALLKGAANNVQILLDESAPLQDPRAADTAIFYSISNTQKGLRGISFGNLLLKRVIEDLQRDLPRLKIFATLSPLPRFRKWLDQALAEKQQLLPASELAKFAAAIGHPEPQNALADTLARPDWAQDTRLIDALRAPLEKICARYLLREKSGGHPVDSVAQFHLTNGARVNRVYWLADTSARGLRQSYGLMVSYRYDLGEVDKNHERFLSNGTIAAAGRVQGLLD